MLFLLFCKIIGTEFGLLAWKRLTLIPRLATFPDTWLCNIGLCPSPGSLAIVEAVFSNNLPVVESTRSLSVLLVSTVTVLLAGNLIFVPASPVWKIVSAIDTLLVKAAIPSESIENLVGVPLPVLPVTNLKLPPESSDHHYYHCKNAIHPEIH